MVIWDRKNDLCNYKLNGAYQFMDQQTGKYIIFAGIGILTVGIIIYFFHDYLKWLGKLPGDIRLEKGNTRFYFPIVTMLIISIVLTVVINIIRRLL